MPEYKSTGTTSPQPIPPLGEPIEVGKHYFALQIRAAQAAFSGPFGNGPNDCWSPRGSRSTIQSWEMSRCRRCTAHVRCKRGAPSSWAWPLI